MDKLAYRQMDKKTKKTERWIKRQTDGQKDKKDRQSSDRFTKRQIHRWIKNGQMDKKTKRQTDR
jgi:hypothetical protein